MSGKKISELPILPASQLDQISDTVVVVDSSAEETKRMKIGDMITSVVNPLIGDKLNNVNDYIQNNLPDLTPPPTPTGFVAIGGVSNINIQHDNPIYTQGHGHLETILYGVKSGSSSSTFEDAIEIARFSGKSFSYATSASTGWRLWIKWKSIDGAVSTIPAGGTNGLYVVTDNQITGIIDALTGQLNETHLTQELNSRIDLIDGNGNGSVNSRIAQEILARNDAVLAEGNARIASDTILNNAIVSESQSRSQIDSVLSNSINAGNITTSVINDNIKTQQSLVDTSITKLNQSLIAISADGTNTKSAIITETFSRNQSDLALTNQLSIAASAINTNASAINSESSTRVDQDSANASVTQSIIAQSQYGLTAISEEKNVRSSADGVLSNVQTALVSSNDQSKASIIEQSNTFINSFSALSSKNDNLVAQTSNNTSVLNTQQKAYTDLYISISNKTDILSTQVNSNIGAIKVEQDTRTTDALSSAAIVTQLVAQNSNNTSAISTEQLSRSTDNISVASNISTLVAKTDNNGSAILTEQSIRSDANQTTGAIINNIKSSFDSVNSYIIQEANTRSSADTSASNLLTNIVSDTQNTKASVQQEILTRSDANSSAAKVIDILKSNANNTTSAIVNESITRSLNDSSNASIISGLVSNVGSNVSAILNESTIRVNADTAYSSQLNILSGAVDNSNSLINSFSSATTTNYNSITAQTNNAISKLGDNIAALDSERVTRVTQDQSTATQVTGLVSSNSNNNAAIQTEALTRSTTNNTISSALTTVSASNNSLSSAIQTEATARLNADQTNANLIQTVQSRLDTGDYAAVKTQASTSASDITGLKAQYTVKTDVNGYVSGFGLASTANNATPTSEFTIVADKFSIAPVGSVNAWNSSTNYSVNQTVYYDGNTYDCIIANSNIVPTNTAYWSKSTSPFFYITSTQVIGDTTIPPGLYVNKANISRLTADQIDTRGLSVKDSNGNIILSAGNALDWSRIGGNGKPADGATVGATFGVNIGGQITAANASTYIANAAIGNALIGKYIASDNFNGIVNSSTGNISNIGTAGWAIGKDGSAVLSAASIRGQLTADQINTNGLTIKDAYGNTVISLGTALRSVNQVFNGDYTDGLAGTVAGWVSGGSQHSIGRNNPGYIVQGEGTAYAFQPGAASAGVVFDSYVYAGANAQFCAVTPGKRYELSAWLNTHRCSGQVLLVWCNSSGSQIGYAYGNQINYGSTINSLADMYQSSVFATAPVGAVMALPVIRGTRDGVNNDAYVFFSRVYFGEVTASQTEPSPWSPGRGISQITPQNASTYIADLAVNTLQIANQAITIPVSAYTQGSINTNYYAANSEVVVQSITLVSSGAPIVIVASLSSIEGVTIYPDAPNVYIPNNIKLYRNGVNIYTASRVRDTFFSAAITDTPGAGSVTYQIRAYAYGSGFDTIASVSNRCLVCLEVKR